MSDPLYNADDISIIDGNKMELIVFSKKEDVDSFFELVRQSQQNNSRTIVSLNSATNTKKFINRFQYYNGKMFLCLEGNRAGDAITLKIMMDLKEKNIKDIRPMYKIDRNGNKDLTQYLQNKLNHLNKNSNLDQQKYPEDEDTTPGQNRFSDTQYLGPGFSERSSGDPFQRSQSKQHRDYDRGQAMGGNDVRNGPEGAERSNLGTGERGKRPYDRAQPQDDEKNEGGKHSVGRILPRGNRSDRGRAVSDVENLIEQYKGHKLTNEQVAEVVSAACFVSGDNKIVLKEDLNISDDLKNICDQFRSGGMAKEGRGILDEYYTDPRIVGAVRNLIKDRFKGNNDISVLEPSAGTGNFLSAAKELGIKSIITAFEINDTTAKIAKILYPDVEVNLRSFETEFIDDKGIKKNYSEKYDLVIGNPPYGEHRGFYKGLGEEPKLSKYEDYFVKRSLDVLKDDGILAMVLPSGWLNRQKNLDNAVLAEAFRLPVGSFAGTKIGTDIIILEKSSRNISTDISNYFEINPTKILGEIKEKTNRFGRLEKYVYGNLDEALHKIEQLKNRKETERIGNLFEDLSLEIEESLATNKTSSLQPKALAKNERDKIDGKESNAVNYKEAREKIETVLIMLKAIKFKSPSVLKEINKYKKLQAEISDKPKKFSKDRIDEILEKAEKIILTHKGKNSEYRLLVKPELKKGILKYRFSKTDDIVNSSLQNSSDILEPQIEAFRDASYNGTLNNYGKHYQFANYIDGIWVHDFYYAEGNIYAKLEQLEIDFKDKFAVGGTEDQYDKQLNLLLNVLPKPKNFDEIFVSPNHEFVHQFALGQVEKESYNYNTKLSEVVLVDYNLAEKFKDFVGTLSSDAFQGSSAWEVRQFVDNETVTGSDKERNALVRDRRKAAASDLFQKFIREELSVELRERFVNDFNRKYNNIHVPDYSRFPLFSKIYRNFKGQELRLTEVQKAGIGRLTTKGVGLLAHEVGFGKTLSGILSMHEAMERGNSKRPLVVVPNDSILRQWVETIFETIPDAKVNVLGNLGKDYDLSKFDNKDGEITIVTYEGFNNIGFSENITQDLAAKFSYISESELRSVNSISERDFQKDLEKTKELEGKMKRGKIYDWEDFGFDHMTFDEVHNANHIVGKVRIEDRRFSSDFRSQNQQTSKLGINTWMAAQYIQKKYDGRNVTLLSATPFTNKPLEYYSILSLIANKRLEESGYFNVNTFFETFMEADTDMEIDAKGDVKFKANVRRFKNNSLFQQLLSEFIDIKGEEDNPQLIRPNKINKEFKIEQNDLTREQYDVLTENFSETEKGAILTHILNARLIAISPYLSPYYDGEFPSLDEFIENSPKLNETMNLIRQNKKDIPEAGQIIYSELAVSEFPRIKEYLVTNIGYNPNEIGIITGATSKAQRISIQNNFNSGEIKIIIGSEAIQEGMNLQENTTDLYLLSLPYNFTTLRQVEGRAWRQGNKHENVRINFMLTNDSIDVFMLQKLQSKQARYLEAMKKGADVLDISDISTQELKTSIITNPETRANIEIELLKKRIESEKNKHLADSAFILRKYEGFLKVQQEVVKAQQSYKRIEGYAKEEGENAEYWSGQIPNYQKTIDAAKILVSQAIEDLAMKGVNVNEIERQTQDTEAKIAELDKRLEQLSETKIQLILQYKQEKDEQMKTYKAFNIIQERADENKYLFRSIFTTDFVEKSLTSGMKYQNETNVQIEMKRKR